MPTLPTFAMISTDIRRDLVLPMQAFTRLRLAHFYRQAPYNDLTAEELAACAGSLRQYTSPQDLLRQLEALRPDIVQNVELFALRQLPYVAAITGYALRRRAKLIAGVHISRPLKEKYGPIAALALRLFLQPTLHATHLFFYLNEGGRRNLLWMGVPEAKLVRLMYGTWGIDPDEFTPERNGQEPNWPPGTILFVGRIHPEKGIMDLLEAFELAQRDHRAARLKLIGSGPQRAEAEGWVAAHHLQDRVEFLGTVKNSALPAYYRAATLFVSPARTTRKWEEYVGMTNIQAMACGVPVISTDSGAIPEYVPPSAGLLIAEGQPALLADAITRLLSDEALRAALGKAGRQYAAAHENARYNIREAEEILLQRLAAA